MLKKIPLGISNFKEIIEDNYFYIDKTKLIEDLLKDGAKVKLFTRPRRFGKTLNMSMLKYFFDIVNAKENKKLFKDLYIEKSEAFKYQGQYPVIFISLKDFKYKTWKECKEKLLNLISDLYNQNYSIFETLNEIGKKRFNEMFLEENLNSSSLYYLTKYLKEYYNKKVILLIDEYDTPIVSAYEHGYYDDAISFFRTFFGAALKDNEYLQMGAMTGILRVAKEGIFSGLNNLSVYTILDNKYSEFFGLTENEVKKSLVDYEIDYRIDEVKEWYDGYKFGNNEIYNPWSILNFLSSKNLESYWINTSDNYLIKNLLSSADESIFEDLENLFNYQVIEKDIDKNSSLLELNSKKDLWQLLLFSGYLTIDKKIEDTMNVYSLKIVNKEIHNFFKKMFIDNFLLNESTFSKMMGSLLNKNLELFEQYLQRILLLTFSYYDGAKEEKFYHNLMLGMILYMDKRYKVLSNREIGLGRTDIILEPTNSSDTAYIFEFKVAKTSEELDKKAEEALEQIKNKKYNIDLKEKGFNVLSIGISFCGKEIKVKHYKS